jgi:PAS domain S-box-containing protein
MEINFIIIYDNTAAASILYASESVYDALGFTPEELIGWNGYELTHPDERPALGLIHSSNVETERMSSVAMYRSRHKDGHYVQIDVVIHYCYDALICTNFAVVSEDCIQRKMRVNSADKVFNIQHDGSIMLPGAWNDSQEKMKELLANKHPWGENKQTQRKEHEPRFCLILNRYTEKSIIVFATKMCESMIDLNQFDCIGRSFYDFIRPQDKEIVMKQIELSKSSNMISRIRFDWTTSENRLIPLEAAVSCTYDGLVLVARLIPFVVSTK